MFSASRVNSKVDKYLDEYGPGSARAYLFLAWWCLRQAIQPSRDLVIERTPWWRRLRPARARLELGFSLNGGIGDCLIQAEYIRHLVARFGDVPVRVTIFAMKSRPGSTASALFHGARFIDEIRTRSAGHGLRAISRFDLFVQMDRFPQVIRADLPAIEARSPALAAYCRQLLAFQVQHRFVVINSPRSDMLATKLAQLRGKTRYNGPDILGVLGMRDDGRKFMEIDPADIGLVERLGLLARPFITIQRGIDSSYSPEGNVRLWAVEKYARLVQGLKARHPDVAIVLMGFSTEQCEAIPGVDLDLRGRTTLGEVKALLKHALLHVDYEGGYAHLREFLHRPAVVLFGPTEREFLGYRRHINIASDACGTPCEWVTEHWAKGCSRGERTAPCMDAISADPVIAAASARIAASSSPRAEWTPLASPPAALHGLPGDAVAFVNVGPGSALHALQAPASGRTIDRLAPEPPLGGDAASAGRHSGLYNVAADDEAYDAVFASIADVDDYPGLVVRELVRVLRPGGTLVLETAAVAPDDLLSTQRRWPAAEGGRRYVAVCRLPAA